MSPRPAPVRAREVELTVIDFETTGDVRGFEAEAWQLGMAVLDRGRIDPSRSFESLLRVGDRPFHPRAPGQHHRLRAEIAAAPTLTSLWPQMRPWWHDRPLVAHNAATERKFVRLAAPLHPAGPWIDTLRLARAAYPGLPSHALEDVVENLGLGPRVRALCPGRAPHDALYDAFACAAFLEALLAQDAWREATLESLAAQ